MSDPSATAQKYNDADGNDAYRGGWSAALSPLFLRFVNIGRPASVLDIGCGTGNLFAALARACPDAALAGRRSRQRRPPRDRLAAEKLTRAKPSAIAGT